MNGRIQWILPALVPGGAGLPAVEEGEEDERERFLKDGWKVRLPGPCASSRRNVDEKAGFVIGGEEARGNG